MALKLYAGPVIDRSREEILRPAYSVMSRSIETFYPSGVVNIHPQGQAIVPASRRWLQSVSVPRFNKLKSDGWIIQNPYSSITEEHNVVPGSWIDSYYFGPNGALSSTWESMDAVWGLLPSVSNFLPPTEDVGRWQSARDEALTRAYSKANATSATLLVDVSQWKQTANLFMTNISRLIALKKSAINFLSGNQRHRTRSPRKYRVFPDGAVKTADELSGIWLEIRMGVRPLLSSLDGIQEALIKQGLNRSARATFRATEDFDLSSKEERTVGWNPGGAFSSNSVKDYYKTTVEWKGSFRAGVLIEPRANSLSAELGFESAQIPYAAWDIVPWSFIVDRFINVGNYIQSLRPIPGIAFGGSWVVERFVYNVTLEGIFPAVNLWRSNPNLGYTRSAGRTVYEMKRHGTIRSIYGAAPSLPVLRHDWDKILDTNNVIDGVALAIQRALALLR